MASLSADWRWASTLLTSDRVAGHAAGASCDTAAMTEAKSHLSAVEMAAAGGSEEVDTASAAPVREASTDLAAVDVSKGEGAATRLPDAESLLAVEGDQRSTLHPPGRHEEPDETAAWFQRAAVRVHRYLHTVLVLMEGCGWDTVRSRQMFHALRSHAATGQLAAALLAESGVVEREAAVEQLKSGEKKGGKKGKAKS